VARVQETKPNFLVNLPDVPPRSRSDRLPIVAALRFRHGVFGTRNIMDGCIPDSSDLSEQLEMPVGSDSSRAAGTTTHLRGSACTVGYRSGLNRDSSSEAVTAGPVWIAGR
jgi:hypothetical protein